MPLVIVTVLPLIEQPPAVVTATLNPELAEGFKLNVLPYALLPNGSVPVVIV